MGEFDIYTDIQNVQMGEIYMRHRWTCPNRKINIYKTIYGFGSDSGIEDENVRKRTH